MQDVIAVVSGLPRSGTSMMMSMLEAGGIPPLSDGRREADDDNPKGYYELEKVKQLSEDSSWLPEAHGKAVKVISQLLLDLPPGHTYRVVFMQRKLDEVLASQRKMLVNRGTKKEDHPDDDRMGEILIRHIEEVFTFVKAAPFIRALLVSYNKVLEEPASQAARVNEFLGGSLDEAAMAAVVDARLYRQRHRESFPAPDPSPPSDRPRRK